MLFGIYAASPSPHPKNGPEPSSVGRTIGLQILQLLPLVREVLLVLGDSSAPGYFVAGSPRGQFVQPVLAAIHDQRVVGAPISRRIFSSSVAIPSPRLFWVGTGAAQRLLAVASPAVIPDTSQAPDPGQEWRGHGVFRWRPEPGVLRTDWNLSEGLIKEPANHEVYLSVVNAEPVEKEGS